MYVTKGWQHTCMLTLWGVTTLTTYMYVDLVLTYILTDVDMVRADILGWSVCMYVPSNKMNRLSWTYILETLFWLLGSSVSMYVTSNKMTRLPRAYILKNIVFLFFSVCYGFSRLYVSPWREMKLLWKILSSHVEHTRTLTNIPGRWMFARVVAKWINFPNIQLKNTLCMYVRVVVLSFFVC